MCVSTMFTISIFTVVQQQTPIHLLGKVMATIIAVSSCFQPIGQAIYGELFENLETISWVIMVVEPLLFRLVFLFYQKEFFIV